MRTEKIETIKRRFHREWLLIAVDIIDEYTTTPISGRVIAHSPHREDIYQRLLKPPKMKKLLVEYSEDSFPRGYAAAFLIYVGVEINNIEVVCHNLPQQSPVEGLLGLNFLKRSKVVINFSNNLISTSAKS